MADTPRVPIGVLGGVCMADQYADPSQHASMDVNGDFTGERREVRRGPRNVVNAIPALAGTTLALDYRGLYAFKSLYGATRLLCAVQVKANATVLVRIAAAPGYRTQLLYAGELVFFLIDPTYYDPAAFLAMGVAMVPWPIIGLCVTGFVSPAVGTPRVAANATARIGGEWIPQFYKQGNTLVCFGHPTGAWQFDFSKLAEAVIQDTFSGALVEGHIAYSEFLLSAGAYTLNYGYFTGSVPQCRVYDTLGQAWYVPMVEAEVGVTTPVASIQDAVPEDRIGVARTTVRWDERMAWFSEDEAAEHIHAAFSWVSAPGDKTIQAIARAGDFLDVIFDDGSLLIDYATLGSQSSAWLSAGTVAPHTVKEIGDTVVFVGRDGIIQQSAKGEQTVSSPFLDALFQAENRSTSPAPLGEMDARLGLPFRIDHARLPLAIAYIDEGRQQYVVALTTVGSFTPNDLLIYWDFGRNRFWFHKQQMAYGSPPVQTFIDVSVPPAPPSTVQTVYLPALACTGLTAIEGDDGKTRAYCCNRIGVWALGEAETDAMRTLTGAQTLTGSLNVDIESFRTTPVIGRGEVDAKTVDDIAFTLWRNVFTDNGSVQVYAEGERGSTQLRTASDLLRAVPFQETGRVTGTLFDRSDRDRGYWSLAGGTWGDGYIWAREDYIVIKSPCPLNGVAWFRVTWYDKRTASVPPVLALVSAQVGAHVAG